MLIDHVGLIINKIENNYVNVNLRERKNSFLSKRT